MDATYYPPPVGIWISETFLLSTSAGVWIGKDVPKSIIRARTGALNLDTSIKFLESLSEYAGVFEFSEVQDGSKKIMTLLHRLGHKGTIFFESYVRSMFVEVGYSPKISSAEHSVLVEVSPESDSRKDKF